MAKRLTFLMLSSGLMMMGLQPAHSVPKAGRSETKQINISSSEKLLKKQLSEIEAESERCKPLCPETIKELENEGIQFKGTRDGYLWFTLPNPGGLPSAFGGVSQIQSPKVAEEAIKQIPNLKPYNRKQLGKEVTAIVRAYYGENTGD